MLRLTVPRGQILVLLNGKIFNALFLFMRGLKLHCRVTVEAVWYGSMLAGDYKCSYRVHMKGLKKKINVIQCVWCVAGCRCCTIFFFGNVYLRFMETRSGSYFTCRLVANVLFLCIGLECKCQCAFTDIKQCDHMPFCFMHIPCIIFIWYSNTTCTFFCTSHIKKCRK